MASREPIEVDSNGPDRVARLAFSTAHLAPGRIDEDHGGFNRHAVLAHDVAFASWIDLARAHPARRGGADRAKDLPAAAALLSLPRVREQQDLGLRTRCR